jgi:AcrR family transcriptional regulator
MIRSEKTRKRIIEKTAVIFNKKGYAGTFLSDLTNKTGLSKGSIYGNFKDKNEVAVEAFKYNFSLQKKKIITRVIECNRADEKLKAILNFYIDEYEEILRNGGCPLLNTSIDSDNGNSDLQFEVIKAINFWIDGVITIIKDGILQGQLKQIDPESFAYKMLSLIEGSIMLMQLYKSPKFLSNNLSYLSIEIDAFTIK